MVAEWPTPNAFLAAIAYGCLEQFGRFVEAEYPFLRDVITCVSFVSALACLLACSDPRD